MQLGGHQALRVVLRVLALELVVEVGGIGALQWQKELVEEEEPRRELLWTAQSSSERSAYRALQGLVWPIRPWNRGRKRSLKAFEGPSPFELC